ncbi:MAG: response regulator, partial [Dehalococcoidia bacterium]|nr:response regulator [Dehalococcoidia bacterium]
LQRFGFNVVTAEDGDEAISVFQQRAAEIDLVLLDMTMPRLDGEATFTELRRIRDDIKVILSSGYNEQEATQRFTGKGLAGFLQKPYNLSQLSLTLEDVLNRSDQQTVLDRDSAARD